MKINQINQHHIQVVKRIRTEHNDTQNSQCTTKSSTGNDNINISSEMRSLHKLAERTKSNEKVRPLVLKRYAEFVNKPLSITDQNIASALRRSIVS